VEFSQQLYRAVFPRVMVVVWFVAFLFGDGVFHTMTLLEKRFPLLVVGPEIRLFAATIFWLCWYVVAILRSPPDSRFRLRRR
jgi:hypothetical protein